jgi:hypothetical protein
MARHAYRAEQLGIARPVHAARTRRRKGNQRAKIFDNLPARFCIDLQSAVVKFDASLRAENLQERFGKRQVSSRIPRDTSASLTRTLHACRNVQHVVEELWRLESFGLKQVLAIPEKVDDGMQRYGVQLLPEPACLPNRIVEVGA